MSAYNFQPQFAEPIRRGTKTQTIRPIGKRRHARPGESIQLYTGMRTSKCRKIIPDPVCLAVLPIELRFFERCKRVRGTHEIVRGLECRIFPRTTWHVIDDQFAIADGFSDAYEMATFFRAQYASGLKPAVSPCGYLSPSWSGVLITWGPVVKRRSR